MKIKIICTKEEKEQLNEEFAVGSPIARVIFGRVEGKGDFTLRVRDTAETLRYLVKFTTADKVKYRVYCFEGGELVEEKT